LNDCTLFNVYLLNWKAGIFVTLSEGAYLVITSWVVIKRERCDTCASHWVAGGDLFLSYNVEIWF
jgi:hypothetical protein